MPKVLVTETVGYHIHIPDDVPEEDWEAYWTGLEDRDQYYQACFDRQIEKM